ncbi:MAG: hypothetical protein H3Z53_03055 [archaeon]|nr:hypothetical protein [archaeon]
MLITVMIGVVDGLCEDLSIEAWIWSGIFFFGFILFLRELFDNSRIAMGLSLIFFGSFLSLMQVVFWVEYAMIRNFPQGPLMGKLFIVPGVIFPLWAFWLSIIIGFVMMIMGYLMIGGGRKK